jgi:hypothetical protein
MLLDDTTQTPPPAYKKPAPPPPPPRLTKVEEKEGFFQKPSENDKNEEQLGARAHEQDLFTSAGSLHFGCVWHKCGRSTNAAARSRQRVGCRPEELLLQRVEREETSSWKGETFTLPFD